MGASGIQLCSHLVPGCACVSCDKELSLLGSIMVRHVTGMTEITVDELEKRCN